MGDGVFDSVHRCGRWGLERAPLAVSITVVDHPLTAALVNGVLLRHEALARGFDDKALTRAVRSKVLTRMRQGAYCNYETWQGATAVQRHQLLSTAVLRIYGGRVMLSQESAVVDHGMTTYGLDLSTVHITYEGANGRTQASVHHHRGCSLPDDVVRRDGGLVTSPARTALETVVSRRSVEVGVCLISDFLHRGLVSRPEMEALVPLVAERPGALILRTAMALADARHESVAESRCRYVLHGRGLPPLISQYEVFDRWGTLVGRADFALPELAVWLEVDGKEKYVRFRRRGESLEDYLIRERRRENRMREATGWEVVRITWADLADPDRVVARILAVAMRRSA